jgi:hypothetical protein
MKKIFAFLFFLNITCYSTKAQSNMLLFGPTLHYNIGGGLNNLVFGLELSYWRENTALQIISPALGCDIGIEDEKGNVLFRVDLKEYTPQVVANFKSFDKPFKWVYWPVNSKGEWVNRIDTNL